MKDIKIRVPRAAPLESEEKPTTYRRAAIPSPRLAGVLSVLQRAGAAGLERLELRRLSGCRDISQAVSELRDRWGYPIRSEPLGRDMDGWRWRYWLVNEGGDR